MPRHRLANLARITIAGAGGVFVGIVNTTLAAHPKPGVRQLYFDLPDALGTQTPPLQTTLPAGLHCHTDGGVLQGTTRRASAWRWSQSQRWSERGG